jgi:hypothetical protein
MKTAAKIIDELGGSTALASALALPATTVASWKSRASIPVQHWPALITRAKAMDVKGITFETLGKLAACRMAEPQGAAS